MTRTWAVVPVKKRAQAKERLGGTLELRERGDLVEAMLSDVLAALCGARSLGGVAVLSADDMALAAARAWGVEALPEPTPLGYQGASDLAAEIAQARGWEALLVVPADVPLLTASLVDDLVAQTNGLARAVVLGPDRARRGTNALLRRPPGAIAAQFGPDSLHRHQQAARARGIPLRVVSSPALALDVDTPDDLLLLLARGGGPATRRVLARLEVSERVPHFAEALVPW